MRREVSIWSILTVTLFLLFSEVECEQRETHARGVIRSAESFTFFLNPGETIQHFHVARDGKVRSGSLILELNGDQVQQRLFQVEKEILELGNSDSAQQRENIRYLNACTQYSQDQMNLMVFEQSVNIKNPQALNELEQLRWDILKNRLRASELSMKLERKGLEDCLDRYKLAFNSLQSQRKHLRNLASVLRVSAPFSGTIQFLNQSHQNRGKTPLAIFVLQNLEELEVEVRLIQSQFVKIREGIRAQVALDFIDDAKMTGVVTRLQGVPEKDDNGFLLFPVTLRLDDTKSMRVFPGMTALVTLFCD